MQVGASRPRRSMRGSACQVGGTGQHGVGPLRAGPQASRVPGCRTVGLTFLKRAHLSSGVTYLRTRPRNQESSASFSQQVRHHHTCNVGGFGPLVETLVSGSLGHPRKTVFMDSSESGVCWEDGGM